MKFTIEQPALNALIGRCFPAVETITTIPILGNLKLSIKDGLLHCAATNLQIAIQSSCECNVKAPGSITLPAQKLKLIVSNLPDTNVDVEVSDKMAATIKCGKSRFRVAGMSSESFPDLLEMPEPLFSVGSKQLARMVARTSFAISGEEGQFTLPGALMQCTGEELRIISTDGHRLSYCSMPNGATPVKFIVPLGVISAFKKLRPSEQTEIAQDDNNVYFRCGETVLTGRKLVGRFPDYERIMPRSSASVTTKVNREDFMRMINRVSTLADKDLAAKSAYRDTVVKLSFGAASITATAGGMSGEAEDSIDCELQGDPLDIGLNNRYLTEFLNEAVTESVWIGGNGPNQALEIRPDENGCRYIVMPRRI